MAPTATSLILLRKNNSQFYQKWQKCYNTYMLKQKEFVMQKLTKIQEINQAIMFGEFTNVELESMIDAIKFARASIANINKNQFRVGSTVKFRSNRNGVTYTGTVEKVKIKYTLVRTNAGLYNVPANMLEAA